MVVFYNEGNKLVSALPKMEMKNRLNILNNNHSDSKAKYS